MIKIPLLYPFLVDSPLIYTYLSVIPVLFLVILITWGFVTIYRLPEKEHRKYESFKQFYGTVLYLFDTILVSFNPNGANIDSIPNLVDLSGFRHPFQSVSLRLEQRELRANLLQLHPHSPDFRFCDFCGITAYLPRIDCTVLLQLQFLPDRQFQS